MGQKSTEELEEMIVKLTKRVAELETFKKRVEKELTRRHITLP